MARLANYFTHAAQDFHTASWVIHIVSSILDYLINFFGGLQERAFFIQMYEVHCCCRQGIHISNEY